MKKQLKSKTAQRKLVLHTEAVVTLTPRALTDVVGGEPTIVPSALAQCTNPPSGQTC